MTDDAARRLGAQIMVHDQLTETLLVYWLAGMTEELGEEFLADYSQATTPEDREAHGEWLDKVRAKAARLWSNRLYLQPREPN